MKSEEPRPPEEPHPDEPSGNGESAAEEAGEGSSKHAEQPEEGSGPDDD